MANQDSMGIEAYPAMDHVVAATFLNDAEIIDSSDQLLSGTFSILATMACLNMLHAPQLLLGARGPYTHSWQPEPD